MPDRFIPGIPRGPQPAPAPQSWREAFAALPLESPQADGWARVVPALDPPRPRRWHRGHGATTRPRRTPHLAWLATAAALLLAIALPWRLLHAPTPGPAAIAPVATTTAPGSTAVPSLPALHAESAQLEALLAYARDERVASGMAAALADELEARIAAIDVALAQPGLAAARERALWAERVQALRTLVGFESTRRWLAGDGGLQDITLAHVD